MPIGSVAVSGLTERPDHQIIVDALCDPLGHARAAFTPPAESVELT